VVFPKPVFGKIPNFIGARNAAEQLKTLRIWRKARGIKSNPDSPQRWVRKNALKQGKTVYMAVPRLKKEKCFLKLDPKKIADIEKASTIKGAFKQGIPVFPDEIDEIDLIITGSVAVTVHGEKIGKGGGFSDLEYGILRELKTIDEQTPIVTTVHELQLIKEIPMETHDVPMNYVVTPKKVWETNTDIPTPKGIYWDLLGDKINDIPILMEIKSMSQKN